MSSSVPPIALGQRVRIGDHFATVRYYGPVLGTDGEWYGVEWEDETRGRHAGTHKGVEYFRPESSSSETSCSFVRPRKLHTGVTFIEALRSRYGARTTETEASLRGHDGRDVPLQLVGFQDLEEKRLSHLSRLFEAGLQNTSVSVAGEAGDVAATAPQLRTVNLTHTLVRDWRTVADICRQLPQLERLLVSENPGMDAPNDADTLHALAGAFDELRDLFICKMHCKWNHISRAAHCFPKLEQLHLCESLAAPIDDLTLMAPLMAPPPFENLRLLNLYGNGITDWAAVAGLVALPALETLLLHRNELGDLHDFGVQDDTRKEDVSVMHETASAASKTTASPAAVTASGEGGKTIASGAGAASTAVASLDVISALTNFPSLRVLSVAHNRITTWATLANIGQLRTLREVRAAGNPLPVEKSELDQRLLLVAVCPTATVVNGSEVAAQERTTAELFYLDRFFPHYQAAEVQGSAAVTVFGQAHPHLQTLLDKHGPPIVSTAPTSTALKDTVLVLSCHRADVPEKVVSLEVPPGLKVLQLKRLLQRKKYLGVPMSRQQVVLLDEETSNVGVGAGAEVPLDDDARDLAYYSVPTHAQICVKTKAK